MDSGQLLREVARLHDRLQRSHVLCCGNMTSAQCLVIVELGRGGPMPMAELVRRLAVDKGWVSRTVEGLAQEGLIVKTASESDRRTVMLALSEAGTARYEELNSTLNALSERVMQHIPAAERDNVQRTLGLLHQALIAENSPVLASQENLS